MKYDVAIVGAGPAGSTTAKILSENGFKVILTDKSKFPRDKTCGGGLPTKVFEKFGYLKDYDLIESFSYGGTIYSQSQKYKVEVNKEKPFLGMVIRKKFDHGLVKIAKDHGSDFIDGKKTVEVKISKKNAEITLDDQTKIQADVIIGADGVWSDIAKKANMIKEKRNVSISLCSEIPLDENQMDKYFTNKRNGLMHLKLKGLSGYGWVFPKKTDVNIGIGEFNLEKNKPLNKLNLKDIFEEYMKILKDSNLIPQNLKNYVVKGAAIPNFPLEKTYSDRLLMVGDAAGLANPFTGEGIFNAMISAELAANTVKKGFEKNDFTSLFLKDYEINWKKEFGKDLNLFIKSARLWSKENENFIKHVSRDEVLSDLLLDVASGNIGIHKIRFKLIRRYLYCIIRDKIKFRD